MMKSTLILSLLLSAAIGATACTRGEKTDSPNSMKSEKSHQTPMKKNYEYSEAGKTDADHLWLEEVEGARALEQVRKWNARSEEIMKNAAYSEIKTELLEVYNSPEKIPYASYRKGQVYNFWQDDKNVRGIWRRAALDSYKSGDPAWETILDFDALAEAEDKNWVYKGADCLAPDYVRCMVSLSLGGKDAVERREFDIGSKSFVKDGFFLSESKGSTDWLDKDHLIVGVDFGEDESGESTLTESGYPRQIKLWKRGAPLSSAKLLFDGSGDDVGDWGYSIETADGSKEVLASRSVTFFESEYYWIPKDTDQADGGFAAPVKFDIPEKSNLSGEYKGQEIISLQTDWRGFKNGALVSFDLAQFMKDGKIGKLYEIFTPNERQSIEGFGITKSALLMSVNDNVASDAYALDFKDGKWSRNRLDFPKNGTISIGSTNPKEDIAFINFESFLEPDTYWSIDTASLKTQKLRSLPAWFDASKMVAEQRFVASSDGTKIPYFIIHPKGMPHNGNSPTLLYGYGGFNVSINPSYSATIGRAWLARGGVYVAANIRGGGEFGPTWHQAGLKEKRQIIYDDFIAVAEDLIDHGVTSPEHLGIHGRSNGGLLMGVMFTQRPDLFGAVTIGVPLLDMRRYDKLLAGASWVGEYGDPSDEGAEGAFIRALSPYHNIDPNGNYPLPYIYTSTKDDRVHPGHARKFAKRLEDNGFEFLYYENIDGGHAGAANLEETANSQALIYSYLWENLK